VTGKLLHIKYNQLERRKHAKFTTQEEITLKTSKAANALKNKF
jgi:hypothetical protein